MNCGSCEYWLQPNGECHGAPPTVIVSTDKWKTYEGDVIAMKVINSHWPPTEETDFCGAYKKRLGS